MLKSDLLKVLALFEDGSIDFPALATFRLEDAGEAHRAIESGETVGKLVLDVRGE